MDNLIFHYQLVIHNNSKNSACLHEAFSTRTGRLYMINPIPSEDAAESEEELEIDLKVKEADRVRYSAVHVSDIINEMERWQDEVDPDYEFVEPVYEDQEEYDLEEDYLDSHGEVIDLVDYIKRNR